MVQYWFPWVDVYQLISIPKKKNQIVAHANAPLNTSHEPESQSHAKTPNKTSNASKSQDVNADAYKRKKKKTIDTHQPQVDDVAFCFTRRQWYPNY